MSVAVEWPDGERQLLTKGAPEAVFGEMLRTSRATAKSSDGADSGRRPRAAGE